MQTIFEIDLMFFPRELEDLETLRHLAIQKIKFSVIYANFCKTHRKP